MQFKTRRCLKIEDKIVAYNKPVFIIAEAGVNHNGSLDIALRLVDSAKKAGADAIKFQTFRSEQVVTSNGVMADYQKKNVGAGQSQLEMLKKLELKEGFYKPILERCKEKGIIFLSSPHGGFESVDFINKLGVSAFKFGSGDLTNLPVLEYAARFKKPMILGTGMANMLEAKEAINCIKNAGNYKIIVLHCTTDYPCSPEDVNLRAMQSMIKELGVLVGYSDHTLGTQVPLMATVLGACVIEKHLTLDNKMSGPDHVASTEPDEFEDMVRSIRTMSVILGSNLKRPTKKERLNMPIVRKSVVASCNIKIGEFFSKKNISIKRPGVGLRPKYFFKILGRKSMRNIKEGDLIKKKDF